MPRDAATILDILVACRHIEHFLAGTVEAVFLDDIKTRSAVLHQLMVIGEAAGRLSDTFTTDHPTIPWGKIRGMRNHLIHGYDSVDLKEVWQTSKNDIATLQHYLAPLVGEEG